MTMVGVGKKYLSYIVVIKKLLFKLTVPENMTDFLFPKLEPQTKFRDRKKDVN